ncbi:MAG: FG-GAP repeat protein [Alphaproteobacteria bacterium]|nr:FG-GAP repeat protein [Alphaproteobacteria bacterium]
MALALLIACRPGTPDAPVDTGPIRPPTEDLDGDGFSPPEDCDDTDRRVYPASPYEALNEQSGVCEGIDYDCDGVVEGEDDGDGDGLTRCDPLDCDDSDATIHVGAPDAFGDGVDQDCDGTDGVGLIGTVAMEGTAILHSLGYRLARADVDADGCDDLIVVNSGAANLALNIEEGGRWPKIHALRGCGRSLLTHEEYLAHARNLGDRLTIWPRADGDRVVAASAFNNLQRGTVHTFDFSVDPPELESLAFGTEVGELFSAAVLFRGGAWHVAYGSLNTNQPSGPIRVYPLPLPDTPALQDLPHVDWTPQETAWQANWSLMALDRDGDGDDELVTFGHYPTPPGSAVGELYVLDGPGALASASETWVGNTSWGDGFGSNFSAAIGIDGSPSPWLLAGGGALLGRGVLFALPPRPGANSIEDAPFRFEGEFADDWFGHDSVAVDLNADGIVDVAVGAPGNNERNDQRGKVFVFLGPFSDGGVYTRSDALVFVGEREDDHFGFALEAVDLDADGQVELYASAPFWNDPAEETVTQLGRVYRLDIPTP